MTTVQRVPFSSRVCVRITFSVWLVSGYTTFRCHWTVPELVNLLTTLGQERRWVYSSISKHQHTGCSHATTAFKPIGSWYSA